MPKPCEFCTDGFVDPGRTVPCCWCIDPTPGEEVTTVDDVKTEDNNDTAPDLGESPAPAPSFPYAGRWRVTAPGPHQGKEGAIGFVYYDRLHTGGGDGSYDLVYLDTDGGTVPCKSTDVEKVSP